MKLRVKKIIAKELLILFLSIAASLLIFISIYAYNYYWSLQLNKISKKIDSTQKLAESLRSGFKQKNEQQLSFHKKFQEFVYKHNNPDKIKSKSVPNQKAESSWDELLGDSKMEDFVEAHKEIYMKDGNLLEFDTSLNYFLKSNVTEFDMQDLSSFFRKQLDFSSIEKFKNYLNSYTINTDDKKKYDEAVKLDMAVNLLQKEKTDISAKIFSPKRQSNFLYITFFLIAMIMFPLRYIYYSIKWSIYTLKQKG